MFRKIFYFFCALFCLANLASTTVFAEEANPKVVIDPAKTQLFFFWGQGCPHCAVAEPVVAELGKKYPTLQILSFEVYNSTANQKIIQDLAPMYNFQFEGVPTFMVGDKHTVGFADAATSGKELEDLIKTCIDQKCQVPSQVSKYFTDNQISTGSVLGDQAQAVDQSNASKNTKYYYYLIPTAIIILSITIFAFAKKSKGK